MPSQGSVTIDVRAQITGYEASLKQLKNEMSKIDPGSAIGKKLSKEIEAAGNQLKALSKNLSPKATSDTQIDNIIDKTNLLGESIQHIARLMQSVSAKDLNFDAFGDGISNFRKEIASLEEDLQTRLNAGIRETISSSDQLKEVFENILNIKIDGKSSEELFQALTNGANKAEEELKELDQKIEETNNKISRRKARQEKLEESSFGTALGRDQLLEETRGFEKEYQNIFNDLRNKVTENLKNVIGGNTSIDQQKLLDSFFGGLTPQNIKEHIKNLYASLESEGIYKDQKTKFYNDIFGFDGNINSVVKQINLEDPQPIIDKFKNFIEQIAEHIGGKNEAVLTELIGKNEVENATAATLVYINQAYSKVQNEIRKKKTEISELTGELDAQTMQRAAVNDTKITIEATNAALEARLKELENDNASLRTEIENLKQQIAAKEQANVSSVRNTGAKAGIDAGQFRISADMANQYKNVLEQVRAREQLVGKIQGVVQQWFSIYAAVRMVSNAIRSVISTIQELDKTITEIAIVTDMTQEDLWGQMQSYTEMARSYASSISGVYKVSQLYYQQGLQTADVMALTEQTLKMARISGLDYAEATNYMTNAVRSFKMEMTEAQRVVDVYSAIAAASATDTTELAEAMSKTASSAEAVGSSFENTTAMMAVMIEATRESASNIGSAMKSIISRYGEMTSDPSKLIDSEGQEMSLNKVDKALQSVGISIHDAAGQFRNFDEVIMELAESWDTIDKNTQRYIATVMAGNRQQSRFLALVSSYDRLKELSATAADSEDASQLQFLKTLDSVDAKLQQLQTSMQSLYVDSGLEKAYKGLLDLGNNVVKTFTQMPKILNLPIPAITKFGTSFYSLAKIVTTAFGLIKAKLTQTQNEIQVQTKIAYGEQLNASEQAIAQRLIIENRGTNELIEAYQQREQELTNIETQGENERLRNAEIALQQKLQKEQARRSFRQTGGMIASSLGLAGSIYASNVDVNTNRGLKTALTGGSAILQGLGTGLMSGNAILGVISALPGIFEAIGMASESAAERISRLTSTIEETSNAKIQSKDNLKTLADYKNKYEELAKTRNQDAESRKEWIDLNNEIAAIYPELIQDMDKEGNYIVDMTNAYNKLREAKLGVYKNDFLNNISAELAGLNDLEYVLSKIYNINPIESTDDLFKRLFISDNGKDETSQYINFLLGLTNSPNNLSASTLEHFFGETGFVKKMSVDQGMWGIKTIERVDENYEETAKELLLKFKQYASENKSLAEAQQELLQLYDDSIILNSIKNFNSEIYNYLKTASNAIDFQTDLIKNKTTTGNKEWLNITAQIYDLDPSQIQSDLALRTMNDEWETFLQDNSGRLGKEELDKAGNFYTVNIDTLYKEFISDDQGKWYAWYNKFIEDNKQFSNELLNELYKSSGQYTREQYLNKIKGLNLGLSEEAIKKLEDKYIEDYQKVIEDFNNFVLSSFEANDDRTQIFGLVRKIGPQYLQGLVNHYSEIINNSSLSSLQRNNQLNAITSLYDTIDNISPDKQQAVLSKFDSADLTSLTGLYTLMEDLTELGINLKSSGIRDILVGKNGISSNLVVNLATEMASFSQSIVKQVDDFNKALSSASKGMALDDAIEMANKLGVSISEFQFEGGQYFFKNAEAIREAYYKYNKELFNNLDEEFNKIDESDENYDELKKAHDEAILAIKQYGDYQVNAVLLQNGQIEQFLESVLGTDTEGNTNWGWLTAEEQTALINAVKNGDISNLPESAIDYTEQLIQYAGLIYNTYGTINNEIANTILNSLESGALITSNSLNADQYARLAATGVIKAVGGYGDAIVYQIVGNAEEIAAALSDLDLDQATLTKLHNEQYKNNAYDVFSNLISSYDNISYETLINLAKLLNKDISEIENLFIKDYTTGTYSSTPSQILQIMEDEGISFSEAASKMFEDDFAKIADYYLDSISKASGYTTKGTTKFADITDFTQIYNELNKTSLASSDLFIWNDLLDTFTLKPEYLNDYLELQKQQLKQLGYSSEWAEEYINSQIKQIRNSIDFNSFISAENNAVGSNARKTLENQLTNYLSLEDPEYQKKLAEINFKKAEREHQKEFWSSINVDSETLAWVLGLYDSNIADLEADLKLSEEAIATRVQEDIDILNKGGTAAVDILKKYKPEATAKEIEAVYRAAIAPLEDVQAQLEYGVGSLVSGAAIDILSAADYTIDDNGVIESIGDLNKAYLIYYQKLKDTNGATIAAINAAYAKVLETNDGEQVIIDVLGDAANMTYTRLGDILASAGKRLDDEFNNISQYIESIGGNKIRITDFAGFANYMGWEANSEEYWSAFKTYNDAMVELNRKAEHNIMEELQNALNAQQGDWVNLTQLTSKIPEELLNQIISGTGAVIEDGILKLDEGASTNIAEIVNKILDITSSSGLLLDNEVNELKDAIQNLLNTYINLFKNGISGSLSNTDAGKLQNWASTLNSDLKLDFTRTAEGLKLSNQSAIELYQTLKSVDSLRANLLFNDLAESLQKSDDRFSSISRTMGTIANLENQIKSARGGNTAELEKQLSLAQEIARVQAADPSSYDFMGRSLPDAFKGPQNYWDSIGEMFKAINTSAQDGYMGIQDFYNIVNEMNNLAALGTDIDFMGHTLNGSLESAASLIEAGFGALSNIDGEGVKIDLSRFGVDFASGADQMNANVQEGIKAMARSQIDMLDALIQMLEAVVAMEELGKIDIDENGIFDWQDMFKQDDKGERINEYLEEYDQQRQKIINMSKDNADFQAALNSFKINIDGSIITLNDILTKSAQELNAAGFSFEQQATLIPRLINAIAGIDFKGDLSDIQALAAAFSELGAAVQVTTDKANIVLYGGYQIEQKDDKYIVNGKEYNTIDQALEANILSKVKDLKDIEVVNDKVVGQIVLGNGTKVKAIVEDGDIVYQYGTETARTRQELYELLFAESKEGDSEKETAYQWALRVGITSLEITPASYNLIQEDIRQQLENALKNNPEDVQAVIAVHPELKSLEGLSSEEIEKKIGLVTANVNANTETADNAIDETKKKATETQTMSVDADTKPAEKKVKELVDDIDSTWAYLNVGAFTSSAISAAQSAVEQINSMGAQIQVDANVNVQRTTSTSDLSKDDGKASGGVRAAGNVALAKGTKTLMGELGPELYVTNGHYYVAGQNGAEFVDLPSDAIVFNHIQTRRLLENGSASRGHAVTNEHKATSLATGNASGPAMASASAALAALKQIRAMWDAMLKASISDLGSKAGLGKKAGGGGGNKDKGQVVKLDSGYIRDLERWYNLLRQIDRLEQDINYEEKLRSKLQADTVANGELIYESQRRTYDMLQRELDDRVELASLKKGYYEQRMAEIQAGPWGQLFYFNEEGVPQMKNLQFLADVFASSEEGGAVHNAREQYAMLQQAGFGSLLQYKEDGSVIEWTDDEGKPREEAYKEAVEAFSAKLDAQTEEVNSLREDYIEEMGNILDLQTQQNEILTQIRENTIAVEQEVLKAIEDFREREIDELQKQRDALSDSADKFIDGLTDSLNKEREMYNSQQEDTELLQMRRQLAILQRSGGSASQIRSLQEQIRQREQEAYFEEQEKQINAIKEASNLQLERLDAQISLMQETLEYQKAHGLLWDQVHEIMQGTHEEITQFVTGNNSEWWAKSATQAQNDLVELDNKIGQWVAHRDDISALGETMKNAINNGIAAITSVVAQVSASQQYTVSGTGSYTIPSGSSNSGGGGGGSPSSSSKKTSGSSKKTSNDSAKSWHVSASPSLSFATQSAAQEYQKKQTNLAWNSYHSNEDDKELYDEYRKWSTAHISQYSGGGLIDYTGPAWVDGTKKKPEGILNAEQLDMLRNSVLTRKNPIAALLADYGNTVSNTANANTYNSIDRSGDTVIENAQVVMNVSKMSNDYDAKQAGKTALEEMLRISRKTKPTSVSRR